MAGCRCPIADWRGLRDALGLRQKELASYLGVDVCTVRRWESHGKHHRCPLRKHVGYLRVLINNNKPLAQKLKASGFAWPFDDHEDPALMGISIGPRCGVDGIPFLIHAKCRACGGYAGPGHSITELDEQQICKSCRHFAEVRAREEITR